MGHIHRLCVTAHRSQSKRSTHTTRHNPTPPSRAIHVVSDFTFSHKRRNECDKSAHDRVLFFWTRKVCKRLEKNSWCLALVAAHTRTPHNDPTRTNFPETNSKKKCPRCTLAKTEDDEVFSHSRNPEASAFMSLANTISTAPRHEICYGTHQGRTDAI